MDLQEFLGKLRRKILIESMKEYLLEMPITKIVIEKDEGIGKPSFARIMKKRSWQS